MDLNSVLIVYLEIISKNEVSFKDLKEKNINKNIVNKMLNLHMIDISSNSRVMKHFYIMGDLNLLYETSLKIADYKLKEVIDRYLFLKGFVTLPLCLELLFMSLRKRDYDYLFEVLFKVKELYEDDNNLSSEINNLLYELSFITKLPPSLNGYNRDDSNSLLLGNIKDYVLSMKKLLFSKRDKEICRCIQNYDYITLKNFLENEDSKFSNLRDSDKFILHVVREIINILRLKKLEVIDNCGSSLEALIYGNNFRKALKVIRRKKERKSFIFDENLINILMRVNYILDNIDKIDDESKFCSSLKKSYCKLI